MSNTFPITNPVYNTRITPKPKVNIVSFGDGYEQRLTEGLNQNPLIVNLVFEVSQSVANTAITFLNARIESGASFDYTLPSEASARKFVCTTFPRTIPYLNRVRLTCVFREVFEP
jgi:phage-related protein|tara:strand:+ start:287 stop:631 length:345 start_codon:yes stop_codon:yes gene_type:complete